MRKLWLIFYFIPAVVAKGQHAVPSAIASGSMPGGVELRTATIWMQVSALAHSVSLESWKEADPKTRKLNCRYQCGFLLSDIPSGTGGLLHTKNLWQLQKTAPDYSFLRGSCACFKNLVYDRVVISFGGDSMIFSEKQLIL